MTLPNRLTMSILVILSILLVGAAAFASGPSETEPGGAMAMQSGMYAESPMLAARVAAGDLPPVEERLPDDPVVRNPIGEVGKYSTQLNTLATGTVAWGSDILVGGEAANLFRNPPSGIGFEPNLGLDYSVAADNMSITIYLREGAKWSDGEPFTSEDARFMFEDMHFNPDVRTWGAGGINGIEVIDDLTYKLINTNGLGSYPFNQIKSWFTGRVAGYHPAHYLKQFHLAHNPDANELAEEEGYESWTELFFNKYWWGAGEYVDLPTMTPWQLVEQNPSAMKLARNPYYWAVDQSGQQLPYFDTVLVTITGAENYNLKVIAGEADIAYVGTSLPNIQLYRENERAGGYTTILWPGTRWADFAVAFNPFNPDEYKKELSRDLRFRQALNLAVDRSEINDSLYFGLAVERQAVPIPSTTYYKPEWEQHFAQYDPARANALLDEAGLDKRDADGYRVRADNGQTLSWVIEYSNDSFTSGLELVREYFEAVGIKTTIKIQDGGVLEQRMNQSLTDMLLQPSAPSLTNGPYVRMWWNYTYDTFLHLSREYGQNPLPENWIDVKPKPETAQVLGWEISGEPAPDWYKEMYYNNMKLGGAEPGSREYNELGAKIGETRVQMLWEVGVVGLAPKPFIVKNTIGNTPEPGFLPALDMGIVTAAHFIDQLYRK